MAVFYQILQVLFEVSTTESKFKKHRKYIRFKEKDIENKQELADAQKQNKSTKPFMRRHGTKTSTSRIGTDTDNASCWGCHQPAGNPELSLGRRQLR